MNSITLYKKGEKRWLIVLVCLVAAAMFLLGTAPASQAAGMPQKSFSSPDEAVKSLVAAVRANDIKEMLAILGPGSKELISSGDDVADRAGREKFLKAYDQMKHTSAGIGRQNGSFYRCRQLAIADPDREEGHNMGFRHTEREARDPEP